MAPDLALLLTTAATIGVVHTLLGPDHYLPFFALSKARAWGAGRTAAITAACGAGHVLSSVAIGAVGIAAGTAVETLVGIEAWRGDLAAWLLFGFGLAYFAWGVKRALRGEAHSHAHAHADGTRHVHTHDHRLAPHVHPHGVAPAAAGVVTFAPVPTKTAGLTALATPWTLFIIFVFGPCEPLIPVLMYPAAHGNWLCASCHGPDAKGLRGLGKDLTTSEFVPQQTDDQMVKFIKTGRPAADKLNTTGIDMPPKGGNPALSDQDLANVIAFVRSIHQK